MTVWGFGQSMFIGPILPRVVGSAYKPSIIIIIMFIDTRVLALWVRVRVVLE